ncbi:MAG TPA: DinB family protein [Chloroflexota bacterium]|jgi:uncharacterized damage-inducible protein DinB|nr:DinB family protein [Chloroflexota bacterium]
MEVVAEAAGATLKEIHDDLRRIVEGLPAEALNWAPGPDTNSIAVLVTHLLGAEHYWLAAAAGRPIAREREAEFQAHADAAATLLALIEAADRRNPELLHAITPETLAAIIADHHGEQHNGAWCLLHALEHAGQHRGQSALTRQLWEQARSS